MVAHDISTVRTSQDPVTGKESVQDYDANDFIVIPARWVAGRPCVNLTIIFCCIINYQ